VIQKLNISPPNRSNSNPQAVELTRLRNETACLKKELSKARQIIDVQGKVSALLQTLAGESAGKKDA
jgi:hypothetical protein